MSESKYEGPGWYVIRGYGVRWVVGELPTNFRNRDQDEMVITSVYGMTYRRLDDVASRRLGTDPAVEPKPLVIEAGKWYDVKVSDGSTKFARIVNRRPDGRWNGAVICDGGSIYGMSTFDDAGDAPRGLTGTVLREHVGPLPWEQVQN